MIEIVCHLRSSLPKKKNNKFQFLPRNLIEAGNALEHDTELRETWVKLRIEDLQLGEQKGIGGCQKQDEGRPNPFSSRKHFYLGINLKVVNMYRNARVVQGDRLV